MSNSQPTSKNPAPEATKPAAPTSTVDFRSDQIGEWQSRQENFFDEQNRRDAAKKAEQDARRQKVLPVLKISGIVLAALLALGIIVIIVLVILTLPKPDVIPTPVINGTSASDISDYRDALQNIYNNKFENSTAEGDDAKKDDAIQAVDSAVNNTLANQADAYENQIYLAKMQFLLANGQPAAATEAAEKVQPDQLELYQRAIYYNLLYNAYAAIHDYVKANEYFDIAIDLSQQVGNGSADSDLTSDGGTQ